MTGATLPHNLDAEVSVLGSMILSPVAIAEVIAVVGSGDYFRGAHRTIHEAIVALHDRGDPVDTVTVADTLDRAGRLEGVGGHPAIGDLLMQVPTAANAGYYARIVADAARRRRAIEQAAAVDNAMRDPATDIDQVLAAAAHTLANGVPAAEPRAALDAAVDRERAARQARRIVDAEERPPAKLPEFVTLTELLARPLPPVTWRIDGWQPADSRVLLAAQYKAGKTTLVGNLIRSLVDGDRFLGMHDVNPVDGTVMLLDFEMPARQIHEWLRDQRIVATDAVMPLSMRGNAAAFDITDAAARARWVEVLRAHQTRYVVWDCVRPVVDALGLDEHREVGPLLVAFDQLLADAGVPDALVIHHMGHNAERSRGDSRLRDWPDAEWRLVREDGEDPASTRYVSAYGRDVAVSESRLAFDTATRRLVIAGGSRRSAKADRAGDAIVEWLATQDEPQSGRAIETAVVDHPRAAVRDGLARLITKGDVEVEPGARGARLHRVVDRLRPSVEPRPTAQEAMPL